ncbi:MAG: hypothetical protein NZ108_05130, partial [Bacteroidia bacterium]|nr:hypothetical protein [Bacteroidia bacterium]
KSAILDDMTLAKAIKKAGFKMNTFSGINTIYCRMYQSFEEVITGFSKNSFAAANYNYWTFSIFLLQFMFWFLLPFCLINSIFIFSVGWILLLKFLIAWKFHHPKVETVLLHPVQILLAFGIAVNSMIWKFTGKGQWKGRNL